MSVLIVDTEGSGLYPDDGARVSVISWACRVRDKIEAGALPFGQGPPGQLFDAPIDAGLDAWERLFERMESSALVFHNAAHDMQELQAGSILGYPGRALVDAFYWDTSVVQRLLDPIEPVALEDSCVRRLGIAAWKWRIDAYKASALKVARKLGDFESDERYDLIPWAAIEAYATEDAVNTLLLYEDQQRRLDEGEDTRTVEHTGEVVNVREIIEREHNITRVLFHMETRGVQYDAAASKKAGLELVKRAEAVAKTLPRKLRPVTPHRICAYYYDFLGYRPTKIDTKTGDPVRSADEFSRNGLREQGAPHIDELDEWSNTETAYTSWYLPWAAYTAPDGRLRMRVRQTKVTSGRFSGERANLLAIPHDDMLPSGVPPVRSFIRPRAGCRLWEVDLGQAEVRVGAVAAQCAPLMEAYYSGFDVYEVAARDIFGVTREREKFGHYRQLCKRLVLASLYAAGAKTLQVQIKKFMKIDIPESECQEFLTALRARYPEFKRAERQWMRYAEKHGYVPLALGERRYFKPYEEAYKALNQRIQGSVAVTMKLCMIEVEREFPGVLLLQVHDSLLLETDDDELPEKVASIMTTTFERTFHLPFIAEIKEWH